jgi:transposase-like protein
MQAIATANWTTVRCPCNRATLGEVRGHGGEVRRVCPKCRGWWVVDCSTGLVRPDETAAWRRASA